MGDSANGKLIGAVITIVMGVIGIVVISQVTTSDLLSASWVDRYTGLRPIAELLPLALVGGLIGSAVLLFRGRGDS